MSEGRTDGGRKGREGREGGRQAIGQSSEGASCSPQDAITSSSSARGTGESEREKGKCQSRLVQHLSQSSSVYEIAIHPSIASKPLSQALYPMPYDPNLINLILHLLSLFVQYGPPKHLFASSSSSLLPSHPIPPTHIVQRIPSRT
jgi:hypothetical protein